MNKAIDAVLAVCFLASGFAALVYQTAWTRELSLVFGTSELAVATVLAAYMGGLALGAWLAERLLRRIRRPVLVYGALELAIGASAALLVPALLVASDALLQAMFGNQPRPPDSTEVATSLYYLVSAFAVLAIPTALMGATLPLLARYVVRTEAQIGPRIGLLYSLNTVGAVGGALATAFWLLPELGLRRSVYVAALINALVALLALGIARQAGRSAPPVIGYQWRPTFTSGASPWWILPLMLASGAVSFFHEVLWTRMLSHVLGSSLHAFGVMVATFLTGIALGGGVGAVVARRRSRSIPAFAICQLGCALTAAGAFLLMDRFVPGSRQLATTATFGALLMLPMTCFIGATFPLAVRILAEGPSHAGPASARVYAWNTVGAIVGAIAAGFVLIPWLRFEGAIRFAVGASAVLAIAALWITGRTSTAVRIAVAVASIATLALFRPSIPERLLRASPLDIASDGRLLHYQVGRSASVIVLEQDGNLVLRTNGLPEALVEQQGAPPRFSGEFWLSPLAVIARPDVERMLIVGYGGGGIVEAVPPTVREIDVIEIEPAVIDANRATSSRRKHRPLEDPRLTVISNDARAALSLTRRRYDAIVSQPSHPWTAGASHLYTLEFLQQAREHLTEDGVFVQWMNVTFLDESLLRSLTATLLEAFGEVRLYRPDPDTLVFLASPQSLDVETALVDSGRPLVDSPRHFGRFGINTPEDLFAALAVDSKGARALAGRAPLITDDHNRLASARRDRDHGGLDAASIGSLLAPYDPLRNGRSWIYQGAPHDRVSFSYIARRLAMFASLDDSVVDRIDVLTRILEGTEDGYIARYVLSTVRGNLSDAERAIREGVEHFPYSQPLLHLFVRPWADELAREEAPAEIDAAASQLKDSAASTLLGQQLEASQRWHDVAALDARLARAKWTDPWKIDAVQLRANWRSRALPGFSRARTGSECIDLIDEALVAQPTLALYGLRARCGLAAGRPEVALESIWNLANGTYNLRKDGTREDRESARRDLQTLLVALEKNLPDPQPGTYSIERRDEVITKVRDRILRLDQM